MGKSEASGEKQFSATENVPSFLSSRANRYIDKDVVRVCDQPYDGTVFKWTWKELQFFSDALGSGLTESRFRFGDSFLQLLPSSPEGLVSLLAAGKTGTSAILAEEEAADSLIHQSLDHRVRAVIFSPVTTHAQLDRKAFFDALFPELETWGHTRPFKTSRYPNLKHLIQISRHIWSGYTCYADLFLENPIPSPLPPIAARLQDGQSTLASVFAGSELLHFSHAAVLNSAIDIAKRWGLGPDDRVLSAIPNDQPAIGQVVLLAALAARGVVIFASKSQDLPEVLHRLQKESASHLVIRPSQLQTLTSSSIPRDKLPETLKHILIVASPTDALSSGLIAKAKEAFPDVAVATAFSHPFVPGFILQSKAGEAAEADQAISFGKPSPNLTIQIVDDKGSVVEHGTPGKIQIRGPVLPKAYQEKWVNTGIKATMKTDGSVYI